MTAPVPPSPWHSRPLIGAVLLLVCGVLLIAALVGGNYWLTLRVSSSTARQVAAAVEKARAIAAAKAQAAVIKSSLRECTALQGLAAIHASPPSATYGFRLQAGILNVFEESGCPELLRQYGRRG